ncbi:MAG: hypothetical protein ACM31C_32105 [Acidobacteriota bacterium]
MRSLALVMLAGCSFIGVTPPPEQPAVGTPIECTDEMTAPVLDGITGVVSAFAGVASLRSDCPECGLDRASGIGGLAVSAILVFSAAYGTKQVGECRDAKARAHQRRN